MRINCCSAPGRRLPDPSRRKLAGRVIQPWQENRRSYRTKNRVRAIMPILILHLWHVLITKQQTNSTTPTNASDFLQTDDRNVSGLIKTQTNRRRIVFLPVLPQLIHSLAEERGQ